MTPVDGPARAGTREWAGLAVLCLPIVLMAADLGLVFLALPPASTALRATATQQLWIVDGYGVMVAGLLVPMAWLARRLGHRAVLAGGAVVSVGASLAAAYAPSAAALIVARGLLGVAAATMVPCALGLITAMFGDGRQLSTAFAVWSSALTGGTLLGPVLGGLLLQRFWWGSVFLAGVPALAVVVIAGPVLLPRAHGRPEAGVGPLAVLLCPAALLAFVYGVQLRAGTAPWWLSAAAIGTAIAVGAAVVLRQVRRTSAGLDLRLLGHPGPALGTAVAVTSSMVTAAIGLLAVQYLQLVLGFSPLRTGLLLLLPAVAVVVAGNVATVVARRIPARYAIGAGLLVAAAGAVLLGTSRAAVPLMTGLVLVNAGGRGSGALANAMVVGTAPVLRLEAAGRLAATAGEFGTPLGVAILGTVAAVSYQDRLALPDQTPGAVAGAAGDSLAGAVAATADVDSGLADQVLDAARTAFSQSLRLVAVVVAVLCVGVAAVAVSLRVNARGRRA